MAQRNVTKNVLDNQDYLRYQFELERFKEQGQMYCPMCAAWHASNTFCQMNSREE